MRKLALSIIICLFLVGHFCLGQDEKQMDGNWWLQAASLAIRKVDQKENLSSDQNAMVSAALYYIDGFQDGLAMATTNKSKPLVCFPENSTLGQDIRIIKKYLEDHPEDLHASGRVLILKALAKAFPCPNTNAPNR
jgi:hypothetical protein